MKVQVQTFAFLKEKLGKELILDLQEGSSIDILINEIIKQNPTLSEILKRSLVAIGDKMVEPSTVIQEGDLVLLMPPASGG